MRHTGYYICLAAAGKRLLGSSKVTPKEAQLRVTRLCGLTAVWSDGCVVLLTVHVDGAAKPHSAATVQRRSA